MSLFDLWMPDAWPDDGDPTSPDQRRRLDQRGRVWGSASGHFQIDKAQSMVLWGEMISGDDLLLRV